MLAINAHPCCQASLCSHVSFKCMNVEGASTLIEAGGQWGAVHQSAIQFDCTLGVQTTPIQCNHARNSSEGICYCTVYYVRTCRSFSLHSLHTSNCPQYSLFSVVGQPPSLPLAAFVILIHVWSHQHFYPSLPLSSLIPSLPIPPFSPPLHVSSGCPLCCGAVLLSSSPRLCFCCHTPSVLCEEGGWRTAS